jgi:uridylate kinase
MVSGVYDSDPKLNTEAAMYDTVTFDKVLVDKLQVMDATAVVMCRDNNLPLRVFDMTETGTLIRAMTDDSVGTLVTADA